MPGGSAVKPAGWNSSIEISTTGATTSPSHHSTFSTPAFVMAPLRRRRACRHCTGVFDSTNVSLIQQRSRDLFRNLHFTSPPLSGAGPSSVGGAHGNCHLLLLT